MSALEKLWQSVAGSTSFPPLPEGEANAFFALVDALPEIDSERSLERGDIFDIEEVLPALVLAEASDTVALDAFLGVTELVPVISPRLQDMTIYVDPFPDSSGHNRMYIRDEEYLPGLLWAAFPSIEDGAEWLATLFGGGAIEQPGDLDDEWELSPWSGAYVLETLLIESVPELWRKVRAGEPIGPPATSEFELDVASSAPHWRRAAALWLLLRLAEGKELGEVADLLATTTSTHATFVAHLRDLEGAKKGQVPAFVADIADSESPLSEDAEAWISESETLVEEPPSEFAIAIRACLEPAVQEMISTELVEIEEPNVEAAVTRLVAAAENVANTKQLIAAVVRTLLDAPEVEEVYGSDTELRSVVIRHFQG